jgi:PAS domain-containing protein
MIGRTINDAVFDWDLETNKIWWNESHFTLFGFNPDLPIPSQVLWLEKIHPDDRHLLSKTYDPDPVSNRQSWSQQVRFLRQDGTIGTLFHRSVAEFNDDKRAVRLMGAFTDITGVKAAEEKLKKNYDQLQALANLTEAVSRATSTNWRWMH